MATPCTGKTLGSANLPVRLKGISSVPVLTTAMFQLPFLTKAELLPRGTHTMLPPALWCFSGVVETLLVISVVWGSGISYSMISSSWGEMGTRGKHTPASPEPVTVTSPIAASLE